MDISIFYFGMMKYILTIVMCLAFVISFTINRSTVERKGNDDLWNEFKDFYKKEYSEEEEKYRRLNWDKMKNDIFQHNIQYHAGNESYHIALNQFSDMHHEEFNDVSTGFLSEKECDTNNSMTYQPPSHVNLPKRINWIKRGYVTKVIDQGKCGACWAFCSIASLEGQLKRLTGKLIKLSEQHLIDCSKTVGNNGCEGGHMCRAFEYASNVGYVPTARSYPFRNKTGECRSSQTDKGATVGGYLYIPYGDEDALLKAVALIGPVAAGVDGSSLKFRHYKSGIYDDENCNNTTLNHAVTIVGYGTEAGKDYWLVKNSWGKSWGKGGFGKLVRNKNNQCGLASQALFPVLYKDANGQPVLNGTRAF